VRVTGSVPLEPEPVMLAVDLDFTRPGGALVDALRSVRWRRIPTRAQTIPRPARLCANGCGFASTEANHDRPCTPDARSGATVRP
jgi:hypothetical protein